MTLTGSAGVLVHSASIYLGVSSAGGDFTGGVTPSSVTIPLGGEANYTLNAVPISGGAGDVALAVNGLPDGALATFSPLVIPASSGTSTLSINVSTGTVPGTYSLILTSTASGVVHQEGITLIITP
jgi:hypothetical protein